MPHSNRGQIALPLRRRRGDPMAAYDALPPELRHWIANAALPWSPTSCLAIWQRSATPRDAIRRLQAAQTRQLARARSRQKDPPVV